MSKLRFLWLKRFCYYQVFVFLEFTFKEFCEGCWCYDLNAVAKEHKIVEIIFNDDTMKRFKELHEKLTKRIVD